MQLFPSLLHETVFININLLKLKLLLFLIILKSINLDLVRFSCK